MLNNIESIQIILKMNNINNIKLLNVIIKFE